MAGRADRAKQFMPFAALKGYYEMILAQEEGYEPERELCDDDVTELSAKILKLKKGQSVKIEYYKNYSYTSIKGVISKLDFDLKYLWVDEEKIWFDDVSDIEDYVPKGRETW